ncbi:2-phospho-L-lactate guanylyltransferase [Leifsonia sp. NPDC058230]|uniref:2-phospho-L-lactate guanylyltransferase n=1 Tax=Leifsonia sp. NPDC058230 TaxID=3346391 RepID=UPI0036D7D57F
MTRWAVVVPFKGGADAKSRLTESLGDGERAAIAVAFLVDTVRAVSRVPAVSSVIVVSNQPGLAAELAAAVARPPGSADVETQVIPDPGGGVNAAVASGLAHLRAAAPGACTAAVTGDLAALRPTDLTQAFHLAEAAATAGARLTFVPDREGSGTTMVALAPGAHAATHFGIGSCAAHTTAGYRALALPPESSLRLDIDDATDLERARLLGLGEATRAVLEWTVTSRSSDPATRPALGPDRDRGRVR